MKTICQKQGPSKRAGGQAEPQRQAAPQTSAVSRSVRESWVMLFNQSGTDRSSGGNWGSAGDSPARRPQRHGRPKGRPAGQLYPPDTSGCGRGRGPGGRPPPSAAAPPQRGRKWSWASAPSPRPPQAPGQAGLGARGDPSFFGSPARTAPAGTYPAAEKPAGGVRGAAAAGKEPSPLRPRRPRLGAEGASRRAAPPACEGWWIRGKLCAPNDKEISCHMGRFEITGIRCSNFAFLSWFFSLSGGKSLLPGMCRW